MDTFEIALDDHWHRLQLYFLSYVVLQSLQWLFELAAYRFYGVRSSSHHF